MDSYSALTTEEKVSFINKDEKTYGSFAEIGAGQEVARCFFQAGLSSNTIAKTISAYDMIFSDTIYGKEESGRYVCENRLIKMLDHEYKLIKERLGQKRGHNTQFFAFANTVAAKSYSVTDGHGWLGLRFQRQFLEPPSDIIIHVNLLDPRNLWQKEAIGLVSVNLIYAALYLRDDLDQLLKSLFDNLRQDRIEIDMVRCCGPAFSSVDHRLMNLHLVEFQLGRWAVFGPHKEVHQPSEILYGKNILVHKKEPHLDYSASAIKQFLDDYQIKSKDIMNFIEMNWEDIRQNTSHDDFLSHIDQLNDQGYYILIDNYQNIAHLSQRLKEQNIKSSAFVLKMKDLENLFQNHDQYQQFNGGVLEAMGQLFSKNTSLYVYPEARKNQKTEISSSAQSFISKTPYRNIYEYLIKENKIKNVQTISNK